MAGATLDLPDAVHRYWCMEGAPSSQDTRQAEQGQSHQQNVRNYEIAARVRHCRFCFLKTNSADLKPQTPNKLHQNQLRENNEVRFLNRHPCLSPLHLSKNRSDLRSERVRRQVSQQLMPGMLFVLL